MDYYLNEENCYNRLLAEYEKYGTIIVAVDFDGTINDFHNEGLEFDNMISLLKKCNEIGFRLVIYTANDNYYEIYKRCDDMGIKIEGINKQLLPQFEGRGKLYYNILIDDRSGMVTSYNLLKRIINHIQQLEKLSKFIHEECWINFAQGIYKEEVNLSQKRKSRWSNLFVPYEDLPESEKEKDRVFARKLMGFLQND